MEQIKDVIPRAIETLEQPTKVNPANTKVWAGFQTFQTLNDPQLLNMKNEAVSFCDDMLNNRTPRWLSLLGTSGAGKTMLAKLIWACWKRNFNLRINWARSERTAKDAIPRIYRFRGGFINWGDAINNRMLQGDFEFLEDLRGHDFFAIDDIASEHQKHRELSSSKLYNVFESRLKKWTVITANLSLEQIGERLEMRIASRMIRDNSVVVDVDVPDFNLRKPHASPVCSDEKLAENQGFKP